MLAVCKDFVKFASSHPCFTRGQNYPSLTSFPSVQFPCPPFPCLPFPIRVGPCFIRGKTPFPFRVFRGFRPQQNALHLRSEAAVGPVGGLLAIHRSWPRQLVGRQYFSGLHINLRKSSHIKSKPAPPTRYRNPIKCEYDRRTRPRMEGNCEYNIIEKNTAKTRIMPPMLPCVNLIV